MTPESQALLTFFGRGRLTLRESNISPKKTNKKKKFSKVKRTREFQETVTKRKLIWSWEQISAMLDIPVFPISKKGWTKLTDVQRLQVHAERCLLPGEYKVTVKTFI